MKNSVAHYLSSHPNHNHTGQEGQAQGQRDESQDSVGTEPPDPPAAENRAEAIEIALTRQPLHQLRAFLAHFLLAHQAAQHRHVGGELLRAEVRVEEVDGEDEPGGQQGLGGMDHFGDVQADARQEVTEEVGEPQDQARRAQ